MAHDEPFFLNWANATCAFVGLGIAVLTLSFTPASARALRITVALISASLCGQALSLTNRGSHEGQSFAEAMFAVTMHIICQLTLEKENTEAPSSRVGFWQKLKWGLSEGFTLRRSPKPPIHARVVTVEAPVDDSVNSENQTKASGSETLSANKTLRKRVSQKTAPKVTALPLEDTRTRSVSKAATGDGILPIHWRLVRLIKSALQFGLFWYLRSHSLIPYITPNYYDFLPQAPMLVRLVQGQLDLRTVAIRLEIVGTSLLMPSLALCCAHNLCAAVFGGGYESVDWPGLYGSLTDAYGIGMWYSHVWHTLMRRAFTLPSKTFVRNVVGLSPASLPGRALIIILAFGISGVMHTLTSWHPGPCENLSYMELTFHLWTGVAIVGERVLIDGYGAWKKRRGTDYAVPELWFWRCVGYIWTAMWWMEVFGAGVLYPWIICRAEAAAYGHS